MKNKLLLISSLSLLLITSCGPTGEASPSIITPSETPSIVPSVPSVNPSVEPSIEVSVPSITPSTPEIPSTPSTPSTPSVNPEDKIPGVHPVLSNDKKTVQYGFYPQTNVKDQTLINELELLNTTEPNGWYKHNNSYYVKETANVYNNEKYEFDNGNSITNGTSYWFKCEPITWNVLSSSNNEYELLSSTLLDSTYYFNSYENRTIGGQTIYPNNYEQSSIREWLNNTFYNVAFKLSENYILDTTVDNSISSLDISTNKYACDNTLDKIYLPSYKDVTNSEYGFISDENRVAKTTDYARATGAWANKTSGYINNGTYWTRSPSSNYNYSAYVVNSSGYLSQYPIDTESHSIRPVIRIAF